MGIYSDGNIYGISIDLKNDTNNFSELFNKIYSEIMTTEQIQEAKLVYLSINEADKLNLSVRFYTSCTTTYDVYSTPFMSWFPSDVVTLEKLFSGGV